MNVKKIIIVFLTLVLLNNNFFADDTTDKMGGEENTNLFLNLINALQIMGSKTDLEKCVRAYIDNVNDCRVNNKISDISKFLKAMLIANNINKDVEVIYMNPLENAKEGDIIIKLYEHKPYSEIVFCKNKVWYNMNALELLKIDFQPLMQIKIKLVDSSNENPYYYFKKGYDEIDNEDYDSAIKDLLNAILLDSTGDCGTNIKGIAYNELGYAYFKKQIYDLALINVNKCTEINNNYIDAYINRIAIYTFTKEYDKALIETDKVLDINPKIAIIYNTRGGLYMEKLNYPEAIKNFEIFIKLIEYDPNYKQLLDNAKTNLEVCKSKIK